MLSMVIYESNHVQVSISSPRMNDNGYEFGTALLERSGKIKKSSEHYLLRPNPIQSNKRYNNAIFAEVYLTVSGPFPTLD